MTLLEACRKQIFWTIDFFKGGIISKDFNEIKYVHENYHTEKSIEIRRFNLDNLLRHAVNTTKFYNSYLNFESLDQFPVIDKNIIRNNFLDFRSSQFIDSKVFKVYSSGSTGTPFKLYQNLDKQNRNRADTIYFGGLSGYDLGTKLIFMRVWTELNRKNQILAWMQNIEMQNVANMGDDEIAHFIEKMQKNKGSKSIYSYASSLEAICKYLDKINSEPINCNLKAIISNSERLNQYTKEAVKKYFSTTVVSRYSNAENGIIAQQNVNNKGSFEINWASYHVEILKFDVDMVAEKGELGRVVITDLFNYCMPIIRYDTGDIACIEDNEHGVPEFATVEGRRQDLVYDTRGELISSFVIGGIMKKYTSLNQYQFIQESKNEYTFKLNTEGEFKFEKQLIQEFEKVLGLSCKMKIEYLDEIPRLASGKRRQVVNNCN